MRFQIKRIARESDEIPTKLFQKYNEPYDVLADIYEEVCCSDVNNYDETYYEIIEIKMII